MRHFSGSARVRTFAPYSAVVRHLNMIGNEWIIYSFDPVRIFRMGPQRLMCVPAVHGERNSPEPVRYPRGNPQEPLRNPQGSRELNGSERDGNSS